MDQIQIYRQHILSKRDDVGQVKKYWGIFRNGDKLCEFELNPTTADLQFRKIEPRNQIQNFDEKVVQYTRRMMQSQKGWGYAGSSFRGIASLKKILSKLSQKVSDDTRSSMYADISDSKSDVSSLHKIKTTRPSIALTIKEDPSNPSKQTRGSRKKVDKKKGDQENVTVKKPPVRPLSEVIDEYNKASVELLSLDEYHPDARTLEKRIENLEAQVSASAEETLNTMQTDYNSWEADLGEIVQDFPVEIALTLPSPEHPVILNLQAGLQGKLKEFSDAVENLNFTDMISIYESFTDDMEESHGSIITPLAHYVDYAGILNNISGVIEDVYKDPSFHILMPKTMVTTAYDTVVVKVRSFHTSIFSSAVTTVQTDEILAGLKNLELLQNIIKNDFSIVSADIPYVTSNYEAEIPIDDREKEYLQSVIKLYQLAAPLTQSSDGNHGSLVAIELHTKYIEWLEDLEDNLMLRGTWIEIQKQLIRINAVYWLEEDFDSAFDPKVEFSKDDIDAAASAAAQEIINTSPAMTEQYQIDRARTHLGEISTHQEMMQATARSSMGTQYWDFIGEYKNTTLPLCDEHLFVGDAIRDFWDRLHKFEGTIFQFFFANLDMRILFRFISARHQNDQRLGIMLPYSAFHRHIPSHTLVSSILSLFYNDGDTNNIYGEFHPNFSEMIDVLSNAYAGFFYPIAVEPLEPGVLTVNLEVYLKAHIQNMMHSMWRAQGTGVDTYWESVEEADWPKLSELNALVTAIDGTLTAEPLEQKVHDYIRDHRDIWSKPDSRYCLLKTVFEEILANYTAYPTTSMLYFTVLNRRFDNSVIQAPTLTDREVSSEAWIFFNFEPIIFSVFMDMVINSAEIDLQDPDWKAGVNGRVQAIRVLPNVDDIRNAFKSWAFNLREVVGVYTILEQLAAL